MPATVTPDRVPRSVTQLEPYLLGSDELDRADRQSSSQQCTIGRRRDSKGDQQQPGQDRGDTGNRDPERCRRQNMDPNNGPGQGERGPEGKARRPGERQTRANTRVPLVPPKPKEFDNAALMLILRD